MVYRLDLHVLICILFGVIMVLHSERIILLRLFYKAYFNVYYFYYSINGYYYCVLVRLQQPA